MANENDELLKELNGELPPLAPGESVPDPVDSRDVLLTVHKKSVPSAVQKANAVHATKVGGKGYKVLVRGEYYANDPDRRGKIKKEYEAEFALPNLDKALSTIKGKLLDKFLKTRHPDFVASRTAFIVDARPLSPETPASNNIQYMPREQLEAHIAEIRAPINAQEYPDVTHLREAIIDYTLTPKGFAKREAVRQKDRAEDRELQALNPGV